MINLETLALYVQRDQLKLKRKKKIYMFVYELFYIFICMAICEMLYYNGSLTIMPIIRSLLLVIMVILLLRLYIGIRKITPLINQVEISISDAIEDKIEYTLNVEEKSEIKVAEILSLNLEDSQNANRIIKYGLIATSIITFCVVLFWILLHYAGLVDNYYFLERDIYVLFGICIIIIIPTMIILHKIVKDCVSIRTHIRKMYAYKDLICNDDLLTITQELLKQIDCDISLCYIKPSRFECFRTWVRQRVTLGRGKNELKKK